MFLPALVMNVNPRSYVVTSAVRMLGILYVGSSSAIGRPRPRRMVRRTRSALSNPAITPSA